MESIYKIASGWRAQVRLEDKSIASKIFQIKHNVVPVVRA